MVITNQLFGTIDFHSMEKSIIPYNCLITNILLNIFFHVPHNRHIHTGLEQLEGK